MKKIAVRKKMIQLSTLLIAAVAVSGCTGGGAAPQAEAQTKAAVNESGMPIVTEPLDLNFFTGKSPSNGSKFEDTLIWKTYKDMSGMNINFDLIPFETLTEKRNLALAGGEYPDVFYSARLSSDELTRYGQQGVFIPLNDLIDQYAPNFKKLMEQYPDIRKGLTMPDGNIYSMPSFYDPSLLSMLVGTPLWINEDWLEQLNMEEPTTTEEFRAYLEGVKNTDLNGNGQADEVPFSAAGVGGLIDQVKGAWGLGTRGLGHKFVDVDEETGELRFTKARPEYKEVLQYINGLHKDGLLDKEIFTIDGGAVNAKGQSGVVGATIVPNPETVMGRKDFIGLGALEGPHGDQLYSHIKVPMVHVGAFAITDKNPNPAATVRWMDYFYGDEGAQLYFMGKEGETFEKAADGSLQYVKDITNNPDGLTQDQALAKSFTWLGGSYPGLVKEAYFKGSETLPSSLAAADKAKPHAIEDIWYNFNFTPEESEFMTSTGQDIQDYVTEMEAKFINGTASFDEWDSYVSTLEKMGLSRYMETYKAAYERYSSQ
ncbi:extracellular solute-binding protein [Saccharibacillus kuerlensis]|uniref:ABC transporter substrate-binding protein n=1 Tax=Saccharibacillus kuerlensis TaxID=459527 RepID=A0ABQ2L3V3_9BACL|nr:extracellular solute-binding protein [Saccharibacillus kuerlensis]GGO01497.1 ABC transporter substrate-binding protein [Saccharibacillus kuerlensis]